MPDTVAMQVRSVDLRSIDQRLSMLEHKIDGLLGHLDALSEYTSIGVDTIDEIVRNEDASGVLVEHRALEGIALLKALTTPGNARKIQTLLKVSDTIPGVMAIAVDSLDELMAKHGVMLLERSSEVAEALQRSNARNTERVPGLFSLLGSMRDPDRRRGLMILLDVLKALGRPFGNKLK